MASAGKLLFCLASVKGLSFMRLSIPLSLLLFAPTAVYAQIETADPPPAPAYSVVPVPSQLELSKLVWSIMVEVHHSNISGNYSVLRDLSAPAFQIQNDPARLTAIFSSLRQQNIDLSNVLLVAPSFTAPPRMVQSDVMRIVGFFGLRPKAIYFDLHFQWVQGRWRLYGIAINPASLPNSLPQSK